MFIDRFNLAELEMLIPARPRYALPWRWMAAAGLLFVLFAVAAL